MAQETSQDFKKIENYLERFIQTDFFQAEIKKHREECGIPLNGLPLKDEDWDEFRKTTSVLYIPKKLKKKVEADDDYFYAVLLILNKIENKLPIKTAYVEPVIMFYFFHNYVLKLKDFPKAVADILILSSLCAFYDDKEFLKDFMPRKNAKDARMCRIVIGLLRRRYETYPISIRINPEASQNDIIDYIKKNWAYIEDLKKKYSNGPQITKVRATNPEIKKRNNFIYKNKDKPLKEIFKLVSDKFDEILDDGHIAKIIWLEKKKRKEL